MVTDSNNERSSNRPYPPPSNVITILHRLRSRNLPERVDGEYLRDANIPDGTITRTLFAMRFLGLITESGNPTEALKSIHTSTDEEYKAILSKLIQESYHDIYNEINLAEDSQDKIVNIFRRYTPASQRSRMVIFFLGMCREAGISILDLPKARTMAAKPSKERVGRPPGKVVDRTSYKGREISHMTLTGINPAIEGLIKSLPEPGRVMSEDRRKQWIAMADATLKFLYPEKEDLIIANTITNGNDEKK